MCVNCTSRGASLGDNAVQGALPCAHAARSVLAEGGQKGWLLCGSAVRRLPASADRLGMLCLLTDAVCVFGGQGSHPV